MKRQIRDILHKYEQTVDTGDFAIDAIVATSYESLIIELMELIEENEKCLEK